MANERKSNRILVSVFQLNNALVKQKNRRMKAYDLTSIQADVLYYILSNYQDREINQLDIQTVFKLTNPTVSGIIDRLEEKEFIKRVRSERDARYRRLLPQPKGEAMFAKLKHSAEEAEMIFRKHMSEAETEEFRRLLLIALQTAEEENGDAD